MEVVGHANDRKAEDTPVTMTRIEVNKVVLVRERVWLSAHDRPVLPLAQVFLVALSPARHVGGQCLSADLNRQELIFRAQRGATQESKCATIKRIRHKVVEDDRLCGRSGMPIKNHIRKVPVDV